MTQINPFTGSIVQAPQVQRTQAAEAVGVHDAERD